MNTAIAIAAAYLIGSFPAAYIAGRLKKGTDIREVGSRNMGAMNVIYSIGIVAGILVLAVDIAKGAAAVLGMLSWCSSGFVEAKGALVESVFSPS